MSSPLLSRLTSPTTVAMGAALGLFVAGVLAIVGGSYAHKIVHDQLEPQKITFADKGLPPGIEEYAGKQVVDGGTAKVFADEYIGVHLKEAAGGQTYAQVSGKALANPKDAKLAEQTQTLFRGETLRGLLLYSWGFGVIGTIALIAGWILVVLGVILFILPALATRRARTA